MGTTIALFAGILTKIANDEEISVTEVFDPKYRRYMGEYFLTSGLVRVGEAAGYALLIAPGIVIQTAWSLAVSLVVDKGENPTEAILKSNKLTYGNKMTIFLSRLSINAILILVIYILVRIFSVAGGFIQFLVFLAGLVLFLSIGIASKAVIYGALTKDMD